MPSGFQQDQNQLKPGYYRVVLTLGAGTGNYGAPAPADGAVNPYDWNAFATLPSTLANGERLARGNLRWHAILEELQQYSDAQILDVEVSSADNTDADSVPTAIAFTVRYDRDEFVLAALEGTNDIVGNVIDTTSKAIKHMVVSGIQRGGAAGTTKSYRVWEPFTSEELQSRVTYARPDVDADVYADVVVQRLDGTELSSVV